MTMKVLVCLFALFAVFLTVKCDPEAHSRSKRGFAYAGNWGPYYRPSPYTGAYASAGFPFGGGFPFQGGFPFGGGFPFSWVPQPVFTWPQNWYEGPNVCKQVKVANTGGKDEWNGFLSPDELSGWDTSFNHESESCWGNQEKYICIKKIVGDNNESKTEATKYECCHGFVRSTSGPGCVESSETDSSKKGKDYYAYVPVKSKQYSSSSSTQFSASKSSDSGDSNVGAVAAQ